MLEYCDYIMTLIRDNLLAIDVDDCKLLRSVSQMKYDLSVDGVMESTKKIMHVTDKNNIRYRITVEVDK
jgi:hypothetical protein